MTDYPFPYDFAGQSAVVTGAARGFGLEFVRSLAQRGAAVVLGDVDVAVGRAATEALQRDGYSVQFAHLDVRSPKDCDAAADQALAMTGHLDIWINNAGIARHGPSVFVTPENWQQPIDIMLSGVFYGARAAARPMLNQRSGTIVNVASINGLLAQAGRASYASAKAGVIRLTEALAAEWSPQNVRVNALAPGVFMTDLVRTSLEDGSANLDTYVARSPMKRLGEMPELIAAMLFLISPFSAYITGQTLRVDGGWTADHYL